MLKKNAWDWIQTVLGWPVDVLIWAVIGIAAITDFALGGWTSIIPTPGGRRKNEAHSEVLSGSD
ncbi:MAG: hypothetical protein Q7K38_00540 [Candidatus Wildermuthbacteria bacterium]|nr:hypothetical protein [Candidatus Wildermuthbacteria bacterium]